jgi:hypothetical protein
MSNLRAATRGRRKAKRSSSAKSMLTGVARGGDFLFCEGGAGGMRQEAHSCLGHAGVGGVKGSLRFRKSFRVVTSCNVHFWSPAHECQSIAVITDLFIHVPRHNHIRLC